MSAPIRVRLTALYVLVLAAIVAALTAFVVTRLRADLIATVDANLRTAAAQIALAYHNEGPLEFIDTAQTVLPGSRSEPAAPRHSSRRERRWWRPARCERGPIG